MQLYIGFAALSVVALAIIGCVALLCCLTIVRAKRFKFVRNDWTQSKRLLKTGVNLVMPWESAVEVMLPSEGNKRAVWRDFDDNNGRIRYDPAPYMAMTREKTEVAIDLWIEYALVDISAVADRPDLNYANILDDAVRAKTLELVAAISLDDLTPVALMAKFEAVKWTPNGGLVVQHVGVQRIEFDAAMQDLLRAKAVGATSTAALGHVARVGFNQAVGQNRNAHLFVDTAAAEPLLGRGTRLRSRATASQ